MKNILLYSSFPNMKKAIENKKYNVIGVFNRHDRLLHFCQDTLEQLDVLFYVEQQNQSDSIDFIIQFKKKFPETRIIYVSPNIDLKNIVLVESLCLLIDKGVYDIFYGEKINKKTIQEILSVEKRREDNEILLDLRKKRRESTILKSVKDSISETANQEMSLEREKTENKNDTELEIETEGQVTAGYDNVIIVSSIKPGTGKSFISTNLAMDIAKFGKAKYNGEKPKVAIIEGDLQTLAIGTLLKVENTTLNLRTALDAVKTIVDSYGNNIGTKEENNKVKEYILTCMTPYGDVPNLHVMAASQVSFDEWKDINPYHYFYLIEAIIDEYDVIIIDSNSSLEHKTTGPILQLANVCFYVIDLEYNNIRMNLRYQQILNSLGVMEKVHYILNKDITKTIASHFAEPLEYDANSLAKDFNVMGRIPLIDTSVILNRLTLGRPIVLDDTESTIDARMEFANIADKLWDMDNILNLKLAKELFESKKKQ